MYGSIEWIMDLGQRVKFLTVSWFFAPIWYVKVRSGIMSHDSFRY